MTKTILILDNDFISDLFGRGSFNAELGRSILDALNAKYDLRITSTVLIEVKDVPLESVYEARGKWFIDNNITPYETPGFIGSNKGELSIQHVLDSANRAQYEYDAVLYKQRHKIENMFGWIKD